MFSMEFWKEFFAALYPTHYYQNIESPLPLININFILIGLYVGLVVGLIAISIKKRYMGRVVRAIIEKEAFSPETAMTPAQLGIGERRILMYFVRRLSFSSPIKQVGVEKEDVKKWQKIDYSGERYYIPEEKRYSAEDRYSTRGTGVGSIIFWAIIFIPVFLILRFVIPELLVLLDNAITLSKNR